MAAGELDLNEITLTPEQVAELAPLQRVSQPKPRLARAKFVQLPYEETLQAAGELQNSQLAVLVELAHSRFKMHQNPVPLSNKALRAAGLSRVAKIASLAAAGGGWIGEGLLAGAEMPSGHDFVEIVPIELWQTVSLGDTVWWWWLYLPEIQFLAKLYLQCYTGPLLIYSLYVIG